LLLAKKKTEKHLRPPTKRQLSLWQRNRRRNRIILSLGIFIIVTALSIIGVGWYTQFYRPLHQIVIMVNDTKFTMQYYLDMLKLYTAGLESSYYYYMAGETVNNIQQNELIRQAALELGVQVSTEEVDQELNSSDPPLPNDYRELARAWLLENKFKNEYFDLMVPASAEHRHIMAMMVESQSKVTEVIARLEAGEGFGELTVELSHDSYTRDKEGDLGWLPEGILPLFLDTTVVDEYAFAAEAGASARSLYDADKFKEVGYWLVEVLEKREETEEYHVRVMLLGSMEEVETVRDKLETGKDFATVAKEHSQMATVADDGGDLGWRVIGEMSPTVVDYVSNADLEVLSPPLLDITVSTIGGYWLVEVLDIDTDREIDEENRDLFKNQVFNQWVDELWSDPDNLIDSYLDEEMKQWAISRI